MLGRTASAVICSTFDVEIRMQIMHADFFFITEQPPPPESGVSASEPFIYTRPRRVFFIRAIASLHIRPPRVGVDAAGDEAPARSSLRASRALHACAASPRHLPPRQMGIVSPAGGPPAIIKTRPRGDVEG